MNAFSRIISRVLGSAGRAFHAFPASMACAVGFTLVTMFRIQLDWQEQEPWNFLFNALHWAFASGAAFGLVIAVLAQSRSGKASVIRLAQWSVLPVAAAAFALLYLPGGWKEAGARFARLPQLSVSRAGVFIGVCLLLFILLAGYPKHLSDFSRSFFLFHKALVVALLYGGVIMAGTSGVAGAVQALLYRDMSEKVYQYLGALVGWLGFAIFAGYFPDYRKPPVAAEPPATSEPTAEISWWQASAERREQGQRQPRFIEILLGNILIPVMLALTVVLLLWAIRILATGNWPVFGQLSGIAASYSLGGLWLHLMTTGHGTGLARFYRRMYPMAALVILVFEAMAFVNQLGKESLKTDSYLFGLVWILAVISAVLLLIRQQRAHVAIVWVACALAVICVSPVVSWQALPVTLQVHRLEGLLTAQGMLSGDVLTPAEQEPEEAERVAITDAVDFLAASQSRHLPVWLGGITRDGRDFRLRFGFEQSWNREPYFGKEASPGTLRVMAPGAVDISGYRWALNLQSVTDGGDGAVEVRGEKGRYLVRWHMGGMGQVPELTVLMDNREILREDMNAFLERMAEEKGGDPGMPTALSPEEMSAVFESPEVKVMLVFNNVEINADPVRDDIWYWVDLRMLYLAEK